MAAVDVEHMKQILQPIWRTKPETASRVRGRLVIDYATAHRYRTGDNPARVEIVRQLLGKLSKREQSHAAVPWRAMPVLFGWLSERHDVASYALRWLILTATRSSEARGAMWSEIDLARQVWTIPEHRMKAQRPHRIPLSTTALGIFEHMRPRRLGEFVFSADGEGPISDTALRNLLRQMGVSRQLGTLHGFRSTFRDWAAENGVPDRIAEAALAHAIGDKTEAAYLRTRYFDQRREVMERWADFLASH